MPAAAGDERADCAATAALQRLVAVHQTVEGVPATLDLATTTRILLFGPRQQARSLARAMVCSAVAAHPPSRLGVAVLCDEGGGPLWDWLKWLPHALHHRSGDAAGPARLVTASAGTLCDLVADAPEGRHLLLVVDGTDRPAGHPGLSGPGVTLLEVGGGTRPDPGLADGEVRIELGRASATVQWTGLPAVGCVPDRCDPVTAEALARRLARPRAASTTTGLGLTRLPGSGRSAAAVAQLGAASTAGPAPGRVRRRRLRRSGPPRHQGVGPQGMGPHGLVIGATGSGKSEFLRTLVLGLAMTHSPEQLNLVLVDFKGGATFAGMAELPHVSAVITNLASELTLVDRMQDALARRDGPPSGAAARRGQLRVGPRLREGTAPTASALEPMPSLLHRRRRVLRDAVGQAGVHRPVRRDRPARPLARPPPPARLAAAGGGPTARASSRTCPTGSACARSAPSESRRGPRRTRRLRAAAPSPASATSSPTSPERCCGSRRRTSRTAVGRRACAADEGGAIRGILPFTISDGPGRSTPTRRDARDPVPASRASSRRCSTSPSRAMIGHGPAAHRCGCRRSTSPTPSTS